MRSGPSYDVAYTLVQNLTIVNLVDCCYSRQTILNCIGGSYSTDICELKIKKYQTVGLTPNNMFPLAPLVPISFAGTLPLGSEEAVFRGPCAYSAGPASEAMAPFFSSFLACLCNMYSSQ